MDALSAVAAVLTITGVVVIAATVGEACELLLDRRRSCVACGTWGRVARWATLAGVRRPFCAACAPLAGVRRPFCAACAPLAESDWPVWRSCYLCGRSRDLRRHAACPCGAVALMQECVWDQVRPFDVAALGMPDAPRARFDSEEKIVG